MTKAIFKVLFAGFCCLLAAFSSSGEIVSTPDYAALQTAVQSGGYVRLDFDGTIMFPAEIAVSKDVELDGSGHKIIFDGRSTNRLFSVSDANLKLRSVTLAHGTIAPQISAGQTCIGGAIFINRGRLTMDRCLVSDSSAFGGVPRGGAFGGAIGCSEGQLAFTNCSFLNNAAIGPAGYSYGVVGGGSAFGGAVWGDKLHPNGH